MGVAKDVTMICEGMNECPKCQSCRAPVKAGRTTAGSQRYRCGACGHKYTPVRTARGYPTDRRVQAVRDYVDGGTLRRSARRLGVVRQTVANGVAAHADALPAQRGRSPSNGS